jgi:CheY-like chemotaxis protein
VIERRVDRRLVAIDGLCGELDIGIGGRAATRAAESSMYGEQLLNLRVLVVEDNRVMADVMRFNFNRAGFDVVVAGNGLVAWELLKTEAFQLLVTDYQMPEMDGRELCNRIRADLRFDNLPIILLTAKGLELDHVRLTADLGVNLILCKPFSPRQLVAAAQEWTGKSAAPGCPALAGR